MIEMILYVLFDLGEIPRYSTKPDLKDCEYVLGRYCELMLRNETYSFNKDEFIKTLNEFCTEKFIDLDIDVVFEVLNNNNIIVFDYGKYKFKSTFWIYYFGAKRMHNDSSFKDFIFKSTFNSSGSLIVAEPKISSISFPDTSKQLPLSFILTL